MAGSSLFSIITTSIFPATRTQILPMTTVSFGIAPTVLAGHSFLGFRVVPSSPGQEMVIRDGRSFINTDPSTVFWSGLCILTMVVFTNGLDDRVQEIAGKVRR